ncbi:hypothetical protein, partial [Enterobacter asburiae]
ALEEVEYGGEYLRVIHGSALKKRWRGAPPANPIEVPPPGISLPKTNTLKHAPIKTKHKKKKFKNPTNKDK